VHKCSAEGDFNANRHGSGLRKRRQIWHAAHAKRIVSDAGTLTPGACVAS